MRAVKRSKIRARIAEHRSLPSRLLPLLAFGPSATPLPSRLPALSTVSGFAPTQRLRCRRRLVRSLIPGFATQFGSVEFRPQIDVYRHTQAWYTSRVFGGLMYK